MVKWYVHWIYLKCFLVWVYFWTMSHNLTKIKPKTTEAYWENNLREKQGKLTETKKKAKVLREVVWWSTLHNCFDDIMYLSRSLPWNGLLIHSLSLKLSHVQALIGRLRLIRMCDLVDFNGTIFWSGKGKKDKGKVLTTFTYRREELLFLSGRARWQLYNRKIRCWPQMIMFSYPR